MRPSPVAITAGDRMEAAAAPVVGGDVTEERHAPTAQGAHLQRMDAVGDGVRHGRAVAEYRTEIVQTSVHPWR